MDLLSVLLIAVALSMDSFAVSISNVLTIKSLNAKRVLTISLSLAFFQAGMPLIGWLAGLGIEELIKDVDHWVAFTLLCLIGAKMIIEGISLALLNQSIVLPVVIIGLVTFGFSLLGLYLGKFFGKRLGKAVEIFGGLVLIGIGLKILIEHQFLNI